MEAASKLLRVLATRQERIREKTDCILLSDTLSWFIVTPNLILIPITAILYSTYIPLNKRKSLYFWKTKLDEKIPYLSIFIIPYQLFLVFLFLSFPLLWKSPFMTPFLISTIVAEVLAATIWYLLPNGVPRKKRKEKGLLAWLVNFTYRHDGDTNGFPSGHVFNSLIASHFLALQYPHYSMPLLTLGTLIAASTVFIKQHYIIDVIGGIGVFFLAIFVASLF